jgi:hypothetical protein
VISVFPRQIIRKSLLVASDTVRKSVKDKAISSQFQQQLVSTAISGKNNVSAFELQNSKSAK